MRNTESRKHYGRTVIDRRKVCRTMEIRRKVCQNRDLKEGLDKYFDNKNETNHWKQLSYATESECISETCQMICLTIAFGIDNWQPLVFNMHFNTLDLFAIQLAVCATKFTSKESTVIFNNMYSGKSPHLIKASS